MSTIVLHTTRAAGTVLTATIYNADHVNHVTNAETLNTDKLEEADLAGLSIFTDIQNDIDAVEADVLNLQANKSDVGHTHPQSDITDLTTDLATITAAIGTNTANIAANTAAIALKANIASPTFTGIPAGPTASQGNNSTQLATTAYVDTGLATKAASSHTHAQSDVTNLTTDLAAKAPLASPALTGTPTAPTASANNNSTQIATTAYVDTADALKAPLASPTFTGTPAAPTASANNNSTQIATTAYADAAAAARASSTLALTIVIDGGGSAITTGIKGDFYCPFGFTIVEWTLLADASGSIVVDIWKDTYANYPPTNADTITASAKPTISSATKGQSSTLTGWTTTVSAGDTLRFNVDSITTCTRVTLCLKVTKA